MKEQSDVRRLRPLRTTPDRGIVTVAAVAGLTLLAAAAGSQEPAFVEEQDQVTASVTGIDPEMRLVSLQTSNGRELTVEAGEAVRNFEQIEVGDRVEVVFYEALGAEITDAPASTGDDPVVVETARAPLGDKPAGATGLVYTAVVTIDDVDADDNTVSFTGPGGYERHVTVRRPEMQQFIKELEAGDRVQITYGEALAVSVRPAN